jgi:predicted metal-binding protein
MRSVEDVERLAVTAGFPDHRWTTGSDVVVKHWVRLKCTYGCGDYGKQVCCPPNVPSIADCREFFREYGRVLVVHLEKGGVTGQELHDWKREVNTRLLELERLVFLSGCHRAMVLFAGDCSLCPECTASPSECRHPWSSRPTPEALGVDVFATVRKLGYPIEVLTDRSQMMNRYAFLLVD